jgi:ubiquinone/menaquinone biosynthesis C-methylase UbiE
VNFDRVAPVYALLERAVFGPALQRARTALLDCLEQPRRALLIGDGDGRFSAELLRRFPQVELDIVEPSAAMSAIAQRRCGTAGAARARWHVLPVQRFEPGERAWDLVVTQFVLDVFDQGQAEVLIGRLAPRTGMWLVAEFQPGVFDLLLRIMYLFFRVAAGLRIRHIPRYREALEAAGLRRIAERAFWRGFIRTELYSAQSSGRRMSLVT